MDTELNILTRQVRLNLTLTANEDLGGVPQPLKLIRADLSRISTPQNVPFTFFSFSTPFSVGFRTCLTEDIPEKRSDQDPVSQHEIPRGPEASSYHSCQILLWSGMPPMQSVDYWQCH
jgi:hypothetical protein